MTPAARVARNGTLILGGGFAGANLARLLGRRGATIVSPESSMLYTPLLPEIAAGAIEPRHAFVPLRMMCPDTEHVRGRAVTLDEAGKTVLVETADGPLLLQYERLVVALGSTAHMPAIPGLNEHAIPFKNLSDATWFTQPRPAMPRRRRPQPGPRRTTSDIRLRRRRIRRRRSARRTHAAHARRRALLPRPA